MTLFHDIDRVAHGAARVLGPKGPIAQTENSAVNSAVNYVVGTHIGRKTPAHHTSSLGAFPSSLSGGAWTHPAVAHAVARHAAARSTGHTPTYTSHYVAPHVAAAAAPHSPTATAAAHTNPTPTIPTLTGPDLVQQQVAGQQQLADRLGQWYDSQLAAANTAGGANTAAATNQIQLLRAGLPGPTTLNPNMTANAQALAQPGLDAQNNAQSVANNGPLSLAQAQIASQGASLHDRLTGLATANDQATLERKNQLLANMPAMEQAAAAAAADLGLKQASADALTQQYNLKATEDANQYSLGRATLGEKVRSDTLTAQARQDNARLAALKAQTATNLAGAKLTAAQQTGAGKYLDSHLYAKDPTTGQLNPVSSFPYANALDGLSTMYGGTVAARAVVSNPILLPQIKSQGPDNFYASLKVYLGPRQAASYVARVFGQQAATNIRRYGSSDATGGTRPGPKSGVQGAKKFPNIAAVATGIARGR